MYACEHAALRFSPARTRALHSYENTLREPLSYPCRFAREKPGRLKRRHVNPRELLAFRQMRFPRRTFVNFLPHETCAPARRRTFRSQKMRRPRQAPKVSRKWTLLLKTTFNRVIISVCRYSRYVSKQDREYFANRPRLYSGFKYDILDCEVQQGKLNPF